MTDRRFLLLGAAPGTTGPGTWGGHRWEAAWQFHDFLRAGPGGELPIDPRAIDALVDATAHHDAIFCESRVAAILAHEWRERGLPPRATLALQVHSLEPVRAVRDAYRSSRGVDPWPAALEAPWIAWLAPTSRQGDLLREAGIPAGRVHRLRIGASIFSLLTADTEAFLSPAGSRSAGESPGPRVVFAGSGRRDWGTILRAALELPEMPCHVAGGKRSQLDRHLAGWKAPWPGHLTHAEIVPVADFARVVRTARVVVVCLLDGDVDGGHTTVVLANRLGVPVVCTESPTLAEYCEPGRTCLTARPGDGAALAAAVRRAWTDETLREGLVREAARHERALDACFGTDLQGAIDGAFAGLSGAT
jgi:glycosyltransferase involved in cell wall biosynthesis